MVGAGVMGALQVRRLLLRPLVLAVAMLAACNTTPTRPTPPPAPPADLPAPSPDQSQAQQEEQHEDQGAMPGAAPSYAPPSADAADVEFEEVAVGAPEEGAVEQPAESKQELLAHMGDAGGVRRAEGETAGGGGAALPPGGPVYSGGGRPSDMTAMPPAAGAAEGDLVGPEMEIGSRADPDPGQFEALMQRARDAAERERASASGAPSGELDGRGERLENGERGGGGGGPIGTGIGNSPDLSGETTGGRTQYAAAGPPPGIPDGRDDDIVARQLREAASKEKDPVLRGKLWNEYRKYKAGL